MLKKNHDHVNNILKDPENPDFSGVVDFSNAVPGPDGSWCITKVRHFYQEIQQTRNLTAHLLNIFAQRELELIEHIITLTPLVICIFNE